MKFNVGDRVIGTGEESGVNITGMVGTVVSVGSYDYGVLFDKENSRFHSLGNTDWRFRGWYCSKYTLAPYEDVLTPEYTDAPNVMELL